MKDPEFLKSFTLRHAHNGHVEIYTTHTVTDPWKWTLFPHRPRSIIRKLRKDGAVVKGNLLIKDLPYIVYTSRCDEVIRKSDFEGRLVFGENSVLHSGPQYAFPNPVVRLSILKTTPDRNGKITIGDNVFLPGTSIVSYIGVEIGSNVMLGPGVIIMDCSGHALVNRGFPGELERLTMAPVVIEDNVWIGAGAVILKGVRIGKNSVVGINSVVHASVPENTVVAGNPAVVIKKLEPRA